MATLNLRVTTTKTSYKSNKSPFGTLSKDLLESLSIHPRINHAELSSELLAADSLDAQLRILHQRVEDELNQDTMEISESLEYLLLLYFKLPPPNPLKARLLKMFKKWSGEKEKPFKKFWDHTIPTILAEEKMDSSISVKNITTLLEYFEDNTDLLMGLYLPFIKYVECVIKTTIDSSLNPGLLPLQKLICYECIHNCVRAFLLIISSSVDQRIVADLDDEGILNTLETPMQNSELPLDTKLNCGLLFMRITLKAKGESDFFKTFQRHAINHSPSSHDTTHGVRDLLTQISCCAPLLNIFTIPELSSRHIEKSSSSVFSEFCVFLFNMTKTPAIDKNTILALNITIERLAEQLSKYPAHAEMELSQKFLNYIITHIDHYLDTVRHRTKTIFEHFINFTSSSTSMRDELITSLRESKMTSRFFCFGIQLLAKQMKVNYLFSKLSLEVSCFIQMYVKAFTEMPASTHLVSTFCTLMCNHFEEIQMDSWISTWINPVLEALNQQQTPALEQVCSRAVQHSPLIIKIIAFKDQQIDYATFICLHIAVKNGLAPDHSETTSQLDFWKGLIPYETLLSAVWHQNDDIRLLVFLMVSVSKKTTQSFCAQELNVILSFFKYNLNNQNSAFRQKFLSHLKKFLLRFQDSLQSLKRLQTSSSKQSTEIYLQFRENLVATCAENLFPSANFGRRCTVLNILKTCFDSNIFTGLVFPSSLSKGLLNCLNDTYEENKVLARQILQLISRESPQSEILPESMENLLEHLMHVIKDLISSTHPSDCVTAVYFLGFCIDKLQVEATKTVTPQSDAKGSLSLCKDWTIFYLSEMIGILENQVRIAEVNILEAAVNGPIYGVIFVIRHLISSIDVQSFSTDSFLQLEMSKIVELCFSASSAVSHIVNNLSPEGHLPMDFTVIEDSNLNNGVKTKGMHATSQLLLLCAWRTIKEISLLFGELIERIPVVKEKSQGFLTEELLLTIGSYFMKALSQIKHRGAFEQAYIGFTKVCLTLWRCPIKELADLPGTWLEEMMTEITTASDKLCATRRSAGVPFIIQALLVSEHEISPASTCFHAAMSQLLDLCESSEKSSISKIHALNILRSLFRSTELGDQVNSYVARGVKIAVLGFNASSWSVRNASTLLLSALLVRIFGVPRSKETLTWKNKMTGRIFFMRYPSLYEFFLSQLEIFDSNNSNLEVTNASELTIFPVLMILARLYPSSLEGTDSNLQLSTFIKYVLNASKSGIHEVRILAATAIASLISRESTADCVRNLFNVLDATQSDNARHGTLLQLSQIIQTWKSHQYGMQPAIQNHVIFKLNNIVPKILDLNTSLVVKESILKLAFYSLTSFGHHFNLKCLISAHSLLEALNNSSKPFIYAVGDTNLKVTLVLILAYEILVSAKFLTTSEAMSSMEYQDWFKKVVNFSNFVLGITRSSDFDQIDTILTFLFYALLCGNEVNVEFSLPKNECEDLNALVVINHDFNLFKYIFSILKLSPVMKTEMGELLSCDTFCRQFVYNLQKLVAEDAHNLYKHKFLAVLRFFPSALEAYCDNCDKLVAGRCSLDDNASAFTYLSKSCFGDNDDSVTIQALHCIRAYLSIQKQKRKQWSQKDFEDLCNILFANGCVLDQTDQIRYAISQTIVENYSLFLAFSSPIDLLNLMTTVVLLSQDDLSPIRENIAQILGTVHESTRNLELLLEEFRNNSQIDSLLFAVAASAWLLKDIDYDTKNEHQENVFDKTDMNAYFEEMVLAKLAAFHLSEVCSDPGIINVPLPKIISQWLINYSNLRPNFGITLHDIFDLVLKKFSFEPESYLLLLLQSNLKCNSAAKQIMSLTKLKYVRLFCDKACKSQ
nr:PREDICTED: thyroid adenoma-associated protein homolog [Bemisia tabaci]